MKFGVQLYTLRGRLKNPQRLQPTLEKIKEWGAETIQLSGFPFSPVKIKEILGEIAAESGRSLEVCATHSPFERIENDLDRLAEEHILMGCPLIGISYMPHKYRAGENGIKEFAEFLNKKGEELKPYNLKIGYHNHWFEFKKAENGITPWEVLIENTNKTVEIILDTYWLKTMNVDIVKELKNLEGRISVLHLKDYKKKFNAPIMKTPGKGGLDWKEIIAAAKNTNIKNGVIELDIAFNPMKEVKDGLKYIYNA